MNLTKLMMVAGVVLALFLTACGNAPPDKPTFNLVVAKPKPAPPPYWMTRPCPRLMKLTRADLDQSTVETKWAEDTRKYEDCRLKHGAFTKWVKERDAKISGKSVKTVPKKRKPTLAKN